MWQLSIGDPAPVIRDADTMLEWFVAWTSLAGVLAWPLVFLVVVLVFRDPVSVLIPKLLKAGAGPVTFDFANSLETSKEIVGALPESPSLPAIEAEVAIQEHLETVTSEGAVPSELPAVEQKSAKEPVRFDRPQRQRVDPVFAGWTFFPDFSTGDHNRDSAISLARLKNHDVASVDPEASVIYDYSRLWNLTQKSAFNYRGLPTWLRTAWARAYLPIDLHEAVYSMRDTARSSVGSGIGYNDAKEFRALVNELIEKLEPYVHSHMKEIVLKRSAEH